MARLRLHTNPQAERVPDPNFDQLPSDRRASVASESPRLVMSMLADLRSPEFGRSEVGLARDDVALASASNGLRNVRIGSRRSLHSGGCNHAGIGWCFRCRPERNPQVLRQRGKPRSGHPMHNPVPLGKAHLRRCPAPEGATLRLEARRRPLRGVPKQLRCEFVIQDGGSGMRGTYPARPAIQQSCSNSAVANPRRGLR